MRTLRFLPLLLATLSCGDSSGPTPANEPAVFEVAPGLSNDVTVGTSHSVSFRYTQGSSPVAGATVAFAVQKGGGSVSSATATTNATGIATTTWTLGTTVGENVLQATTSARVATATLSTRAGAVAKVNLAPAVMRIGTGDEVALLPAALDAYDNIVTNPAFTIATSNSSVASINGMRVTGGTRGSARVTANVGAIQGSADVTVIGESMDRIMTRCPTAAEVASLRSQLNLTFEADPTIGTLTCTAAAGSLDLTLLQQRAYQALLMMKEIQFTEALPWTSKQIYDWLTAAITGIRFRDDIEFSFCCQPARVINVRVAPNLSVIHPDVKNNVESALFLAGLYIHEARHAEGYPHTCGSNDQTLAELGAWGVQYWWEIFLTEKADPLFVRSSSARTQVTNAAASLLRSVFCT